ncbi:hypothetical protein BC828DRAFT_407651 [Blastocladiella britannica]|nr:hypothetical protein BC828DRAFT_407651 [Blastocladiella britannica]
MCSACSRCGPSIASWSSGSTAIPSRANIVSSVDLAVRAHMSDAERCALGEYLVVIGQTITATRGLGATGNQAVDDTLRTIIARQVFTTAAEWEMGAWYLDLGKSKCVPVFSAVLAHAGAVGQALFL